LDRHFKQSGICCLKCRIRCANCRGLLVSCPINNVAFRPEAAHAPQPKRRSSRSRASTTPTGGRAALERFVFGPRKGTICETGRNAWTAAAPSARGTDSRRFQLQRVELRWVPGHRILSNDIPANGVSASTSDRSAHAECDAPPSRVLVARHPLLLRLSWRLWQLPDRLSI
jgi:hypothetical protein